MVCSLPGSSVHEDSPDRNTRVGCHALLQGISATQGLNPGLPHCRWILYQLSYQGNSKSQIVLYSPWNSPGQNTGVHSLSLLQGIFPTQGLNPGLPQSRQNLYQQSYKGSLRILEWVAIPSPANLPNPGIRTGVSCFATLAYQLSCQGSPGMNVPKTLAPDTTGAFENRFCLVGVFGHDLIKSQKVSSRKFTQMSSFSTKKHLIANP